MPRDWGRGITSYYTRGMHTYVYINRGFAFVYFEDVEDAIDIYMHEKVVEDERFY